VWAHIVGINVTFRKCEKVCGLWACFFVQLWILVLMANCLFIGPCNLIVCIVCIVVYWYWQGTWGFPARPDAWRRSSVNTSGESWNVQIIVQHLLSRDIKSVSQLYGQRICIRMLGLISLDVPVGGSTIALSCIHIDMVCWMCCRSDTGEANLYLLTFQVFSRYNQINSFCLARLFTHQTVDRGGWSVLG
jgi:hypothetical protein